MDERGRGYQPERVLIPKRSALLVAHYILASQPELRTVDQSFKSGRHPNLVPNIWQLAIRHTENYLADFGQELDYEAMAALIWSATMYAYEKSASTGISNALIAPERFYDLDPDLIREFAYDYVWDEERLAS